MISIAVFNKGRCRKDDASMHSFGSVDLLHFWKILKMTEPANWTDFFHRNKKYGNTQAQEDAVRATMQTIDISVANQH